jgi:hypothetical protein
VAHRASLHHVRTVLDEDGLDAPTEALNLCGNCSRALERRLSSGGDGEDEPEVRADGGTPLSDVSEGDTLRVEYDSPRTDRVMSRAGKVMDVERWETDGGVDTITFLTPGHGLHRIKVAPEGGHIVEKKANRWTKLGRSTDVSVVVTDGGEDHADRERRKSAGDAFRSAAKRHAEAVNRGEKSPGGTPVDPDSRDDEPTEDREPGPVEPADVSEGDTVTVEVIPLPLKGVEQYPTEVTGEVIRVDRLDTREYHETGHVVISADGGLYTLTYEPGTMAFATGEPGGGGVVYGDPSSVTREPEDTATDGGEYEPERATLRDGEQPDMDAHARRNAAQLALAEREGEDGGDA